MPTLEATAPVAPANLVEVPARTAEAPIRIVEVTRLIRASRRRIYEAWTSPAILLQWFGPADRICTVAEIDLRAGGAYRIGVRLKDAPDSPEATATGRYVQVIPSQLLEFNWTPSWNPGEDSQVTVSLQHVHGGTEVTIRHVGFAPEAVDRYREGWVGSLTRLAQALERF